MSSLKLRNQIKLQGIVNMHIIFIIKLKCSWNLESDVMVLQSSMLYNLNQRVCISISIVRFMVMVSMIIPTKKKVMDNLIIYSSLKPRKEGAWRSRDEDHIRRKWIKNCRMKLFIQTGVNYTLKLFWFGSFWQIFLLYVPCVLSSFFLNKRLGFHYVYMWVGGSVGGDTILTFFRNITKRYFQFPCRPTNWASYEFTVSGSQFKMTKR